MTSEEFVKWLDGVQRIEHAEWVVEGDPTNAMVVNVKITADGETKTIFFGAPMFKERTGWKEKAALCMIANRVMKQANIHMSFDISSNEADVVNYMRKVLNKGDS